MKIRFFLPAAFSVLTGCLVYAQQGLISGYIRPDTTWENKVYLSHITDFNHMFTASKKLIIAAADIDSKGYFNLPFAAGKQESLYRLHIIKKGDPVSTLIIGSEDENHLFFIANDSSTIELKKNTEPGIIDQSNIIGNKSSTELNNVLFALSNENITRDSLKNFLVQTAETCFSPLVGLFAIHSTFGLSENQKKKISKIISHYDQTNMYGKHIYEEFKVKQDHLVLVFLSLLIVSLLGFTCHTFIQKRKIIRIKKLLSQREINIATLILKGKSNKEIATIFNIELSTVKTHVNNLYGKLKINERKELQKYEHIFIQRNSDIFQ